MTCLEIALKALVEVNEIHNIQFQMVAFLALD